jgi:membrane fusion protein (multidrug efflux system)
VSELEVLQNRAQRDVAAAQVQAAGAEVRKTRLDLGYTEVRAPLAGRAGHNEVDPGNLVGAGEQTLLTTIVRYDPIYVYFSISERQLLHFAESELRAEDDGDTGAEMKVLIDENPIEAARVTDEGYPFHGVLDFADQGIDRATGTLRLRAIFPNPRPRQLIPGLFVRGRLPIRERENALLVSERALGSDQSGRYLLVVDDQDVTQYRSVHVGALVDGMRVIEEGLEPTDRVITNGILFARPGAVVKPELESTSRETAQAATN